MPNASLLRVQGRPRSRLRNVLAIALTFSFLFPGRAAALPPIPLLVLLYAKPGGPSSGSCQDWAHACDLQYALSLATPTSSYNNNIYVEEGTYKPGSSRADSFLLRNYTAIYGGFSSANHDNRNSALYPSVLSGDLNGDDSGCTSANRGDNSYHVLQSSGVDNTGRLDGFHVMRGNADNLLGAGGGLYIGSGNPVLTNLVFSCNTAYMGGAVYNGGTAQLLNVTFDSNSAQDGGAYIGGSSLANSIFINNHAQYGGAIRVNGSLALTNVTLTQNSADFNGGGINVPSGSSAVLKNVILWGDAGGSGSEVYNQPDAPAGTSNIDHSVVQDGCPSSSSCTNLATADPKLGSLLYNGGSMRTIALGAGSSAKDAGDDSTCASAPVSGYDQRGIVRPHGPHCDIGSYESEFWTISGDAGVANATLSGAGGPIATADSSGNYVFIVPESWSDTITPSMANFGFTPDHRDYAGVSADQTNQDYVAVTQAPTILRVYPADGSTACFKPKVGVDLLLAALVRTTGGSFDPSTVTLKLDATTVTGSAIITESGASLSMQATILFTPTSNLSTGAHQGSFIYPTTGGPATYNWSFNASNSTCPTSAQLEAPVVPSTEPPEAPAMIEPAPDGTAPGGPIQDPYRRLIRPR